MKQYLDLLKDVKENGVNKGDRTGTGTRSVFGRQIRFDLAEGFPLVTTKKMFTRGAIEELLWFLRGSVDVQELQDKNVNFWDSWQREDGTIGEGYGKQFCNIKFIKEVVPRTFRKEPITYPSWEEIQPLYDTDTGKTAIKVGQEFTSQFDTWRVIEETKNNTGRAAWTAQSLSNGFTKEVSYNSIQANTAKNPFLPTVEGVGYYGNSKSTWNYYTTLVNCWRDMLKRCYNGNNKGYPAYGGKGIFVCERWLNFENFYKDCQNLPQWSLKLELPGEYSLDKDILAGSNCYHPEVCMWADREEQAMNASTNRYFSCKDREGEAHYFSSLGELKREYDINLSHGDKCLKGTIKTAKGFNSFEYLVPKEEGNILRYRKINQLKRLIADIKHTPDSRRLIISLWNAHDIDYMQLPCCHGNMIQFYVVDGKLSCHVYQRSGDLLLGVPVNIASYALLTMMVAQVCDLEVGEFIHTFGDLHIYNNHMDQVDLQLTREPEVLPTMVIDPNIKDIDKFTIDDFYLVNYKYHPAIKAPVAI